MHVQSLLSQKLIVSSKPLNVAKSSFQDVACVIGPCTGDVCRDPALLGKLLEYLWWQRQQTARSEVVQADSETYKVGT
jgi:hypothetical protein